MHGQCPSPAETEPNSPWGGTRDKKRPARQSDSVGSQLYLPVHNGLPALCSRILHQRYHKIEGRPLFGDNYERTGESLQKRKNILKSRGL